jgi:nucleoside-diphosphate-sugar epimerase
MRIILIPLMRHLYPLLTHGRCPSFREIAEIIAKKTGAELIIPATNNGLLGAAQEDYMDTSRMRREFNKYQYMSLENGLAATIAWQKQLLERS